MKKKKRKKDKRKRKKEKKVKKRGRVKNKKGKDKSVCKKNNLFSNFFNSFTKDNKVFFLVIDHNKYYILV